MNRSRRHLAFFGYLLGPFGALFVLLRRRDDAFAVFHARQSLALGIAGLFTPLIWAALAWVLAWIPTLGPMLGVILFSLVLAVYTGLSISWLLGLYYSLKGLAKAIPLVGTLATRRRAVGPANPQETNIEVTERMSSDAEYYLDRSG